MRVLLVSDSEPVPGGAQYVCHRLGRHLLRLGHNVGTLRPEARNPKLDYASGAETFALDTSTPRALAKSISMALGFFQPDVVHVVAGRLSVVDRINTLVRDRPWLVTIHNPPPYEATIERFHGCDRLYYVARNLRFGPNVLAYAVCLRRWRFARAVCYSNAVSRALIAYGCSPDRVDVVPLGAPERDDHPGIARERGAREYPRLATVAGIAHHKGLHDALALVPELVTEYPGLRYEVVGSIRDRSYASHLDRMVRRLRLFPHVSFVTDATDATKLHILRDADLYLQPSHEEGFCLAFLEAAMETQRLVGTEAGEMSAMAAGDPLMRIAPPMDRGALRQHIMALLATAASPEVLAARRRRLAQKYCWSNHAAAMVSIYRHCAR